MRICLACMSEECAHAKKRGSKGCLSAREVELSWLVSQGMLNKQIAYAMRLTEGSVKVYLTRIFEKLQVPNRAGLAAWAAVKLPNSR